MWLVEIFRAFGVSDHHADAAHKQTSKSQIEGKRNPRLGSTRPGVTSLVKAANQPNRPPPRSYNQGYCRLSRIPDGVSWTPLERTRTPHPCPMFLLWRVKSRNPRLSSQKGARPASRVWRNPLRSYMSYREELGLENCQWNCTDCRLKIEHDMKQYLTSCA
jgi:hypothetical protein